MNDLFDGYLELDAVAGFLVDGTAGCTRRTNLTPNTEQHAHSPKEAKVPLNPDVNGHNQ
jgi:hypothetical protein